MTDSVETLLVGGGEGDLESGSQWPSLAVLFNVKRKTSCTVTIISPWWLVTSYSCVHTTTVNPLEQFVLLAKNVKGAAAVELIKQALEAPAVFVFGELLDMPNIQVDLIIFVTLRVHTFISGLD